MSESYADVKQHIDLELGHKFYRYFGKRVLDILLSGLALVIFSPLLLILCVLVRIKHGSPILFTPTRPGMNEKIFHLLKFRSMSNATNSEGKLLPEKDRLTLLGKFLRASSLDELPELVNIFRGDMSIVGPRPLSKGYLISYTKEQRIRHSVRPGLTGLAQISGRNNLPWDQRTEKDLEYVRNMSFKLDCSIILKTVFKVLRREDITIPGGKDLDLAAYNLVKEEGKEVRMKADTTWPEIGSHFWMENEGARKNNFNWNQNDEDGVLTFSGRAAIALAVRDAMKTKQIKKAYVPSYCCLSMLQPLIDMDIAYDFYDVEFDGGKIHYQINQNHRYDLLLIMKYFGVDVDDYEKTIKAFKDKGCVIIEDLTHTYFDESSGSRYADYHVASLRKWLPAPAGGLVSKAHGHLSVKPDKDSNHAVEKKIKAMLEKDDYMHDRGGSKESFLQNFSSFEQDLIQLDIMLRPDDTTKKILESYDIEEMKRSRRENAKILRDRLAGVEGLCFLNGAIDLEKQVPLFMPVMLKTDKRDALRKYLIDNGVYCPIHWPEIMGAKPGIRENELSLICDQRYNKKDMNAIADMIIDWCARNMKRV